MRSGRYGLSSVGVVGALTGLAGTALDGAFSDTRLKWLIVAGVGTVLSVLWLELASRYAIFRVRRERAALERVLAEYDRFDAAFSGRLMARIRDLQDGGAARRDIAGVRAELNQFRRQYTAVFANFRERSADLLRQISG